MEPGDRLPSISLERAEGDGAVNLRHGGRDATVIVKLPATDAARFLPYLERLAAAERAFRDWSGRLLAVLGAAPGDRPLPGARDGQHPPAGGGREGGGWIERMDLDPSHIASFRFPVLRDDPRATEDWAPEDEAGVVIADRYGVVYHAAHGRSAADLPDTDEVVDWLRYLATQCPECGVPDEPGLGEFA